MNISPCSEVAVGSTLGCSLSSDAYHQRPLILSAQVISTLKPNRDARDRKSDRGFLLAVLAVGQRRSSLLKMWRCAIFVARLIDELCG